MARPSASRTTTRTKTKRTLTLKVVASSCEVSSGAAFSALVDGEEPAGGGADCWAGFPAQTVKVNQIQTARVRKGTLARWPNDSRLTVGVANFMAATTGARRRTLEAYP